MINSLSAELDMLRPSMLQSGLSVVAHNLNRKNSNLRLFEFGKTYAKGSDQKFIETNHLAIYISGSFEETGWKTKPQKADFYYLKGIVENVLKLIIPEYSIEPVARPAEQGLLSEIRSGKQMLGTLGEVPAEMLSSFDIKHPVWHADLDWDALLSIKAKAVEYREISKFPVVNRDLAVVVDKNVSYNQVEQIALSSKIQQLKSVQLFDVFESEKLGAGKKSMAVSFTFLDENKTLTDKEIDAFMQKIVAGYESTLQAEIRK